MVRSPASGTMERRLRAGCAPAPAPTTCALPLPSLPFPAAAVMIADVSGFTALTEALGGQGSAGVELLTKCMNRYFTKVGWGREALEISSWWD